MLILVGQVDTRAIKTWVANMVTWSHGVIGAELQP